MSHAIVVDSDSAVVSSRFGQWPGKSAPFRSGTRPTRRCFWRRRGARWSDTLSAVCLQQDLQRRDQPNRLVKLTESELDAIAVATGVHPAGLPGRGSARTAWPSAEGP